MLDSDSLPDVFARNVALGSTDLVSVNISGSGSGNGSSFDPTISGNGEVVAFGSSASDLHVLDLDAGSSQDVFARSLLSGTTDLVSINADGTSNGNSQSYSPTLSADGSKVAFFSRASDLHPLDANMIRDVFVRDLVAGNTDLASRSSSGLNGGNQFSDSSQISADGTTVAFQSLADDLVSGDFNLSLDVFTYELTTQNTLVASAADSALPSSSSAGGISSLVSTIASNGRESQLVSADGRYVVFISDAPNLVSNVVVTPGIDNVYRRDRLTEEIVLVSINFTGTGGGDLSSLKPVISADDRPAIASHHAHRRQSCPDHSQTVGQGTLCHRALTWPLLPPRIDDGLAPRESHKNSPSSFQHQHHRSASEGLLRF